MTSRKQTLMCILLVLSLGIMSGYLSNSGISSWYQSLNKPSFNPPDYLFGPVWTLLYVMLGIALSKIWSLRFEHPSLLILFIIQLLLNILWSPLFFLHHHIDWALIDLGLMCFFVLILLVMSVDRLDIIGLLLPYALWIGFAFTLNYKIWMLN